MLDTETGVTADYKLTHASGEAERFYRGLASAGLVGIEAVGNDQWLIQLLQKLGHEVWIGDAAQIRASYIRKQKTDRRDARHILQLLLDGRFPRIWVPSAEMRMRDRGRAGGRSLRKRARDCLILRVGTLTAARPCAARSRIRS